MTYSTILRHSASHRKAMKARASRLVPWVLSKTGHRDRIDGALAVAIVKKNGGSSMDIYTEDYDNTIVFRAKARANSDFSHLTARGWVCRAAP